MDNFLDVSGQFTKKIYLEFQKRKVRAFELQTKLLA